MSLVVLVGNPKANSRTLRVAQGVADALELGATAPTRGLHVTAQSFNDLEGTIGPRAGEAAPRIARHLT